MYSITVLVDPRTGLYSVTASGTTVEGLTRDQAIEAVNAYLQINLR